MNRRYPSVEEDEDTKAGIAMGFLVESGMMNTSHMDVEANRCFLGVCATLYHLARHRMIVEQSYESAAYLFRSLDHYTSSLHPTKFDEQNNVHTGQPYWPVSDFEISNLRRAIVKASNTRTYDREFKEKDRKKGLKPLDGNAFGIMPWTTLITEEGGKATPVNYTVANAFKIYVYDVSAYDELVPLTAGAGFCKDNQWGWEVLLHYWFLACPCRTDNPMEADFFFVPQYTVRAISFT